MGKQPSYLEGTCQCCVPFLDMLQHIIYASFKQRNSPMSFNIDDTASEVTDVIVTCDLTQ